VKPTSIPLTAAQRLAQALTDHVTDDRLATAISEALAATQTNRDGTITPDHRTRLQAAQLGLAYAHGRPVERSEIVQVNLDADNSIGLAERLKNSPALRRSLRAILESVELS
jgi:hypothetical protein